MVCILCQHPQIELYVFGIWLKECEAKLKGHSDCVNSAVFSPDGMLIVSASIDQTARIWDTVTRGCKAVLKGHTGSVNSAVFSPDGMNIVSVCTNHVV